jgi:nucleotide-binding universal stress UspA family protein
LNEQAAATGYERVETRVVDDQARHQAIVAASSAHGCVLCMATHGRGGLSEAVLGSTAEAVLRDTEQALLLVGPATATPPAFPHGDLVVTTDGSDAAESILPVASDWIRWFELRPWVVEVLPAPTGTQREPNPAVESAGVRHFAETLPGDTGHRAWEVLHGSDVADELVRYAERLPASLIAMASHGRTGVRRVALGSVAMRVVRHSPCPVLVHRSARLTN